MGNSAPACSRTAAQHAIMDITELGWASKSMSSTTRARVGKFRILDRAAHSLPSAKDKHPRRLDLGEGCAQNGSPCEHTPFFVTFRPNNTTRLSLPNKPKKRIVWRKDLHLRKCIAVNPFGLFETTLIRFCRWVDSSGTSDVKETSHLHEPTR